MSKHTPGPWVLGTHPANHNLHIVKPVLFGSKVFVLPECEGGHVCLKNVADANLIAAAPDLLEALEDIAKGKGSYNSDPLTHATNTINEMIATASAAIAKARGES